MAAKHIVMTLGALALLGCGSAAVEPVPSPPETEEWSDHDNEELGDASIYPVLEGRAPKRLTVDQLRQSVPDLLEGQTWHSDVPYLDSRFLIPLFDLYGPTLGEADYITTSVNFLDPIPSFVKYVDEMAASVCVNALFEEGNDSIVKYPEDVDQNLRYLRLKFHGVYVPPGEVEGIAALRTLYDTLYDRYFDHPNGAYHVVPWLGVCMAVMTDPEFYIY